MTFLARVAPPLKDPVSSPGVFLLHEGAASPRPSPPRTTSLGATSAGHAEKLPRRRSSAAQPGRGIGAGKLGKAKSRDVRRDAGTTGLEGRAEPAASPADPDACSQGL